MLHHDNKTLIVIVSWQTFLNGIEFQHDSQLYFFVKSDFLTFKTINNVSSIFTYFSLTFVNGFSGIIYTM